MNEKIPSDHAKSENDLRSRTHTGCWNDDTVEAMRTAAGELNFLLDTLPPGSTYPLDNGGTSQVQKGTQYVNLIAPSIESFSGFWKRVEEIKIQG